MLAKTAYKFKIDVALIDRVGGSSEALDGALTSIEEKCDYLNNAFPYVVLIFALTSEQLNVISNGSYDFGITISRSANAISQDDGSDSGADVTYDKIIMSDVVRPFAKPAVEKIPSVDSSASDGDSAEVINQQKTKFTVKCVSPLLLKYNSKVINSVYVDATLSDALANIVSTAYSGSAYIQGISNKNVYRSIIIPPLNLIPAIKFLQAQYSVYSSGINAFFDGSKLYVYDIKGTPDDGTNKFIANVVNATQNTDSTIYQSFQIDESSGETDLYLKATPAIGNVSDIFSNEVGTISMMNSYDDSFNLVTRSYKPGFGGDEKIRYFWNDRRDKSHETGAIYEFTKMMTLSIQNYDPSLANPDTAFTLSGSTIDYANGRYVILQKIFAMTTTNFKTYSSSVDLLLAK